MSLVATYVLAQDGNFYKEPTIIGNGWFLCFDDDDPPEVVWRKDMEIDIVDELKKAGIKFEWMWKRQSNGNRCFDWSDKDNWKFYPAFSQFIKILEPIPVPKGMNPIKKIPGSASFEMCGGTHPWFPEWKTR